MLLSIVERTMVRELAAMRRTVEAYPDDTSLWIQPAGIPNAGGTLVLHVAGNLRHFVGHVLGGSDYRRDRDAEFARRNVTRDELLSELDSASEAVQRTLPSVDENALVAPFPQMITDGTLPTSDVLVHLATHLAYHLGQLDYHRRLVTGDSVGVGAMSPALLAIAPLPADAPTSA